MVGPTPQIESSAPPPPQQPQTATASAEEEALKRNTDCVYFLASPLTCKKGSECEYRHSDIARVNPRDCWYWLNSNCLNSKCAFRHPPLDGLLGTQAPSSAPSAVPPLQAASAPIPNASTKQGVACIFFQKGYCLKGDWCPFLHGPNPASNKNTQVATMSTADPASFKNTFAGPEKSTQEKKVPSKTVEKSIELPSNKNPAAKVEPAQPRAEPEFAASKKTLTTSNVNEEFPSYGTTSVSPANNGRQASRSIYVHQQPHQLEEHGSMNSKDIEEISREPSPGFDVLVDNELRDSDYYPGEDQYAMSGDHEGRNEYDIAHSADYNSMVDVDRDMYRDPRGYDSYERLQGYARDPHRSSSERMPVGSAYQRRRRDSVNSPDRVGERDLRHRLSKHRRGNGLRSVITHEYARDRHVEDKGHKVTGRDAQYLPPSESSLSSRLRGRIKLPLRSSPHDHGRSSFGRTQQSTHPGRLRDRIKGRDEDDFNFGGRTRDRREMKDDNAADFAGPKSLSELKSKKNVEIGEQQSLGKRKHSSLDGYQQIGVDLSFQGPKPLVEILKQKRGETTNNDDNNQKKEKSGKMMKITSTVEDQRDSKSASGDNGGAEKYGSSDAREVEAEGEMVVEDQLDEQENEAYEQRDGASDDYEQVEGEYYDDIDEGENGEAEDEYPDDEDGDDFAKKMGVIYS